MTACLFRSQLSSHARRVASLPSAAQGRLQQAAAGGHSSPLSTATLATVSPEKQLGLAIALPHRLSTQGPQARSGNPVVLVYGQ